MSLAHTELMHTNTHKDSTWMTFVPEYSNVACCLCNGLIVVGVFGTVVVSGLSSSLSSFCVDVCF